MHGRLRYGTHLMPVMSIITLPCCSNILEIIDQLKGVKSNHNEITKCRELGVGEGILLLQINKDKEKYW